MNQSLSGTRPRLPKTQRRSDLTAVIADLHLRHAGKHPRYLVRLEHLQTELDVRKHDVGRTARDDIHGLPVLLPRLDLAAGKFAPKLVSLDDEAASMLRGKRGEPDLARPSLP